MKDKTSMKKKSRRRMSKIDCFALAVHDVCSEA
jgi:hypothetical protein